MKILMLNSEYNGCAHWRMFEPARWLNRKYKDMHVTYFPHEALNEKLLTEWEDLANSHDIIVCARTSDQSSLATFLAMREISQKPIVTELDDDWTSVDKQNISYKFWYPGSECQKIAEEQLKRTDFIQLSTRPLANVMRKYCTRTFVNPNLIDVDRMLNIYENRKKAESKQIRIGWAGGATHYGDFVHSGLLEALEVIATKYGPDEVKFVFCGMKADFFTKDNEGWAADEVEKEMRYIKKSFTSTDRIEYHDGTNFWDWHQRIADLDLDIVVVPLKDNKFNRSKSNCRFLEFASLKVPGVYSDVECYSESVKEGETGLLAKNKQDWIDKISKLIEDRDLRRKISEQALQSVFENYSFQSKIQVWKDNYTSLYDDMKKLPFVSYVTG